MIGLEGSGFTICLGVILLLTGIVMYYCKSKISACENKMNTMLALISELHSEVNSLKQQTYSAQNEDLVQTSDFSAPTTQLLEESDSEESDSEQSDGEEVEEVEVVEVKTLEGVINPFETHPYKELIPTSSTVRAEVINESSESEDDTDDDASKEQVKVVDLSGQIEELALDDLEEEDEEDLQESSEEEIQIDYGKMQVTALKKLATDRQLAPNIHKLRKKELVNLLQSH